jgi:hypothetical protein
MAPRVLSVIVVAVLSVAVGASAVLCWQHRDRSASVDGPRTADVAASAVPATLDMPSSIPMLALASATPVSGPAIATPRVTPTTAANTPTVATGSATANTASPRAIDVATQLLGHRMDPAAVSTQVARLRPRLEACYAAPDCARTGSPWCISPRDERQLEWLLFINPDGGVQQQQHGGGGLQTSNCVGELLSKLRFAPYTPDATKFPRVLDNVKVTITIR